MGRLGLLRRAVGEFALDLHGLRVLTELATGPFAVTPVLAALAGAESVTAVGADSVYGTFEDARRQVSELARAADVEDRMIYSHRSTLGVGARFNIVTNLGHLRPIDANVLNAVEQPCCVALMWEPWEYRSSDVDLVECARRGIPVIGTNESNELVDTGAFVGLLAVKLLMDVGVAIRRTNVLVVGTWQFTQPITRTLSDLGSRVAYVDIAELSPDSLQQVKDCAWDAVVVANHVPQLTATEPRLLSLARAAAAGGVPVVNISGLSKEIGHEEAVLRVHPGLARSQGHMTATTGALGDHPVVFLHAGGLRAAQDVCRALQSGVPIEEAVAVAARRGFGLAMTPPASHL